MERSIFTTFAHALVLIGALNWGLIGLGSFMQKDLNVVNMVVGASPMVEAVVYILVGLSAIYTILIKK